MSCKLLLVVPTLLLAGALAGCDDSSPSRSPTAPSSASSAAPQPSPQPTGIQPTVAAIAPNVGSVHGGAWGTITGTEFESGATVRLGDSNVQALVLDSTSIAIWTIAAHGPGTVDVVVTNPGGLAGRLTGGFTFAPRESFDFNGDWVAHAGGEFETDMQFTIRNDVLVSVSCGTSVVSTLSPSPSVVNGEFSFRGDDGFAVSGTLVSPANASGTIDVPGVPDCTATRWWADKK
jgi:IPT/TIG domain